MNDEWFGDDDHYYAAHEIPYREEGERRDSALEYRVRQLLASQETDVKERVEQACKQANLAIREYLRSETALKLSNSDRRQNVPYQVVDGIPVVLAKVLEDLPDPILLLLLQQRSLLNRSVPGLDLVMRHFPDILRLLGKKDTGQRAGLESSKQIIEQILAELDDFDLPELIRGIQQDVLGAYFFRIPTIQIYWMPIGLFAGILDVSVEDLAFVVLAHELAHAYTHLGFDIDGVQWETEPFARTSNMIVEGLAQFYTESICKKYSERQPGILEAFSRLLEKQPAPYTHFKNWTWDHISEVVRFSMISTRSNNIRDYGQFLDEMAGIESRIRVR